ncbi:MAG: hypothetical protein K6T75_02340 [Acetobacteraceae bacterium]|nr:hypothetical protein [Acetobacteraceae bacterium]
MKVTFPHMGTLYIPVRAMLSSLGVDVVVPPPVDGRAVALGAKHAPELACFPLKVNLGNYLLARELGADTILMAGGTGPCRFGYYAQVQREILRDLGLGYEMIVLEPPQGHLRELRDKLRRLVGRRSLADVLRAIRLAWSMFKALDEVDREVLKLRCRELKRGAVDRVRARWLEWVGRARTPAEVKRARDRALRALARVAGPPPRGLVRVGLVGEIFMVLEPAANLGVAERLNRLGAEVDQSVWLSDWIRSHVLPNPFRFKRLDPVRRAARPYLSHFVGGEGLESVGNTVRYAQRGYDGVIQIMPFTCMPEIVAQSILPRVSADHGIPVLTLIMDEHSAEAGLQTRLEAFVDLLRRRREKGLGPKGGGGGVDSKSTGRRRR